MTSTTSRAFLLRVELPDVPGSLGALATALRHAGADIQTIEIIEHEGGVAVDDVLLALPTHMMPDVLDSACHDLEGVRVQWVSRYPAGGYLRMDLEVAEAMADDPRRALDVLVELTPSTFRADWAMALQTTENGLVQMRSTSASPASDDQMAEWFGIGKAQELIGRRQLESVVLAAAQMPSLHTLVVFGRHGGPELLGSEIARLGYLASLAESVLPVHDN